MCGIVIEGIGVVAHAVFIGVIGFRGVVGEGVGVVTHAVIVTVIGFRGVVGEGVTVVADAVIIAVFPFVGVVGEGVGVVALWIVAVTVVVAVGCLRSVVVKIVGVVAHTVVVCVGPFVFVVGEGVALISVTVAVGVVVDDFNRVRGGDRGAVIGSVAWGHRHFPKVPDGGGALTQHGHVVVLWHRRCAFDPPDFRTRFRIVVRVVEVVIGKQICVVVRCCDRIGRAACIADEHVGGRWRCVRGSGFGNRDRGSGPCIATCPAVALGGENSDVDVDGSTACGGGRPVKGPGAVRAGGVCRREPRTVDLHRHDAHAGRGKGAFVDKDVEATVVS